MKAIWGYYNARCIKILSVIATVKWVEFTVALLFEDALSLRCIHSDPRADSMQRIVDSLQWTPSNSLHYEFKRSIKCIH